MEYIPDEVEKDIRTLIDCKGGPGLDAVGTDYFVYERMFSIKFLIKLTAELEQIEKIYAPNFTHWLVNNEINSTVMY